MTHGRVLGDHRPQHIMSFEENLTDPRNQSLAILQSRAEDRERVRLMLVSRCSAEDELATLIAMLGVGA